MSPLAGWDNFYVIIGSSAGALIGLQFVVMALIANLPRAAGGGDAGNAFATPNVVHFGTALLISGLLTAPWQGIIMPTVLLGILGLCGILYVLVVARRMRAQTLYQPVFEDWLCHAILPFIAYAMLAVSAYEIRGHAYGSLFVVAAAVLLLLFVAIHNAWDAATYHVLIMRSKKRPGQPDSLKSPGAGESRGEQERVRPQDD
ncbi:MAG TPA: hypothetical protein VMT67_11810 [Terriglobales bacterium]|nr:hypothetical protein [Terriglobales bacterium]